MSGEEQRPDTADQQTNAEGDTDLGGLRDTLSSARRAFGRSFDPLTGAEFRRLFEEFSNVVTTTVLGIHRDQEELSDRLMRLEQNQPSSPSSNKIVIATFLFSLVAVFLAIVALVISI